MAFRNLTTGLASASGKEMERQPPETGGLVGQLVLAAVLATLFSIFVSGLLFAAALALWIGHCWKVRRIQLRWPRSCVLMGLFVVLAVISVLWSPEPLQSLGYLKKLVKFLYVPLICTFFGSSIVKTGFRALFTLVTATAVAGIAQYFWLEEIDLLNRTHGFMSHWMTYSGQLMFGFVGLSGWLLTCSAPDSWRERIPALLALLVTGLALGLTMTRSAWLGAAAGVIVLLTLLRKRWVLLGLAAMLLLLLVVPAQFRERFVAGVDLSDTTTRGRLELLKTGGRIISEHPWFGAGPRTIPKVALEFRTEAEFPDWAYQHLHNNVVQIAAELGIPAAVAWTGFWIWIAVDLLLIFRFRRQAAEIARTASIGLASVVAFLVAGIFEYNFGDAEVLALLLLLVSLPFSLSTEAVLNMDWSPGKEEAPRPREEGHAA